MEFSRQDYWSGLPFPSPRDLPDPGIKRGSPVLQAYALPSEPPEKPIDVEILQSSSGCHGYWWEIFGVVLLSPTFIYWESTLPHGFKTHLDFDDSHRYQDPLEEGLAIHSSILAWRIPWREESDGLWFIGSQRVGHNWSNLARTHKYHSDSEIFLFSSIPSPLTAPIEFWLYSLALTRVCSYVFMYNHCLIAASILTLDTKLHEGRDQNYFNHWTSGGVPNHDSCVLEEHFCPWKYFKKVNPHVHWLHCAFELLTLLLRTYSLKDKETN